MSRDISSDSAKDNGTHSEELQGNEKVPLLSGKSETPGLAVGRINSGTDSEYIGDDTEPGDDNKAGFFEYHKHFRHELYLFLEAKNGLGVMFEFFIFGIICINVLSFILGTEPNIDKTMNGTFNAIEIVSVIIFTIEYLLRLYAAPEDPTLGFFNNDWGKRLQYLITFFSVIDLIAILPFYLELIFSFDIVATQWIRLLRLLRMLKAEGRYVEAITQIDDVFRNNKILFMTSGFAGAVVWIIVAALFWFTEKGSDDPEVAKNFASIPRSLFYTLLMLFGEFPITNFSPWGKALSVFVVLLAVGVVGIPTGILGAGFMDLVNKRAAERKRKEKKQAADKDANDKASDNDDNDDEEEESIVFITSKYICDTCEKDEIIGSGSAVDQFLGRLHLFLEARTTYGVIFEFAIFALIITNVIAFVLSTVDSIEDGGKHFFDGFELVSVIIFTIEYLMRLASCTKDPQYGKLGPVLGRLRWMVSFYALVDILAVVPFYVDVALPLELYSTTFIRAFRLLRMFKMEEYVEAFTIFDDVLNAQKDLLVTSGFAAGVAWVIFASLMYLCERHDDEHGDPPMSTLFDTVPKSMWYTLLMLTGEFPLADFTIAGKITAAIIGVFAVAVFSIPAGILGAGFEEWVVERAEQLAKQEAKLCRICGKSVKTQREEALSTAQAMADQDRAIETGGDLHIDHEDAEEKEQHHQEELKEEGFRAHLYHFLHCDTDKYGVWFEYFIFLVIFVNIVTFTLETDDAVMNSTASSAFDYIEAVSVAIFTAEYALRFYAAPEDENFRTWRFPRLRYIFSAWSFIDLISIVPFYVDLFVETDIIPTTATRIFRLFRLLNAEGYQDSVKLFRDVFSQKAHILFTTGFVGGVLWVIFATLLYLAEHDDSEHVIGYMTQGERFKNVVSALPYTLVLLTGDYPLIFWNTWGKIVNIMMIFVGVGLVAIPSGIIASGFTTNIKMQKKKRLEQRKRDAEAAALLFSNTPQDGDTVAVTAVAVDEESDSDVDVDVEDMKMAVVAPVVEEEHVEQANKEMKMLCSSCRDDEAAKKGFTARLLLFLQGDTFWGLLFEYFILGLIAANSLAFILSTEEDITDKSGMTVFDVIEYVSVAIFTVEYAARVWAAGADPAFGYSRLQYLISFFAVIDFLAIMPTYLGLAVRQVDLDSATILRVMRLLRLLKAEHYVEAFTVFDNVWRRHKETLIMTVFIAFVVWFCCATGLYYSQRDNHKMDGGYDNLPNALFFSALALNGEWALIDFTWVGFLIAIVMCILAIAVFGIPAGIFFGGFEDILTDRQKVIEERAGKDVFCYICNAHVKYFPHVQRLDNDDEEEFDEDD